MKRFFPASLVLAFIIAVFGRASAFSNSLNLNTPGAKARSMGGAFIGLADDFSAIYWNPAGLAWIDKKMSFGLSLEDGIPSMNYQQLQHIPYQGNVLVLDSHTQKRSRFSGLAAGCYSLGDRWVVGFGVYSPVNHRIAWNSADMKPVANNDPSIRWASRMAILTVAPSLAYKLNDRLSVGVSLCLNSAQFGIERYAGNFLAPSPDPPYSQPIDLGQFEESLSGWGFGAVMSILYRPDPRISVGASFRWTNPIKLKGEARVAGFPSLSAALQREIKDMSGVENKIKWPAWMGLGIAFRPREHLTLTADLQWTSWSRFDFLQASFQDSNWRSYMGERGNDRMPMYTEDTLQVRFGADYQIKRFAVRAGVFTDPASRPGKGVNILFPSLSSYGITLGVSSRFHRWTVDLGFEYLAPWKQKGDLGFVSVYPPSSGTIWEFLMPGKISGTTFVSSLSVGYGF